MNQFISTDSRQIMDIDELKELLRASLIKKTKSQKVLEWFDVEFHTIYEAGRFRGLEDNYNLTKEFLNTKFD